MLEVNKINVFHGDLQALWEVSLAVGEGEIVSLIGANGAGKSTIVESIASLLSPASGDIRFQGTRLDKEPAHKVVEMGICLIPEERGLFPGMSVLENLELGAFTATGRTERDNSFKLVYELFPAKDVMVVGAGTGNDVAAALRHGVERIDAVEIDPTILDLGNRGRTLRCRRHSLWNRCAAPPWNGMELSYSSFCRCYSWGTGQRLWCPGRRTHHRVGAAGVNSFSSSNL